MGRGRASTVRPAGPPTVRSTCHFLAFELLASEEVTSQAITYQEEVVKQSQASLQEMGEDLAGLDILFLQKRKS